jgi:hypothetical protein
MGDTKEVYIVFLFEEQRIWACSSLIKALNLVHEELKNISCKTCYRDPEGNFVKYSLVETDNRDKQVGVLHRLNVR